jgi:hypothetical protein
MTEKGHAKAVMREATRRLADIVHEHNPASISFVAEGSDEGRVGLYRFLTRRTSKLFPEYVGMEYENNAGDFEYALVRKQMAPFLKRRLDESGRIDSDVILYNESRDETEEETSLWDAVMMELVSNEDPCGAGSPGGGGFQRGNTCGSRGNRGTKIKDRWEHWRSGVGKYDWENVANDFEMDGITELDYEVNGRKFTAFLEPDTSLFPTFRVNKEWLHIYDETDDVEFSFTDASGTFRKTGKGDARAVMRETTRTLAAYIKEYEPAVVGFTSSDREYTGGGQYERTGRTDLYRFLTKRSKKLFPGYTGIEYQKSENETGFALVQDFLMPEIESDKFKQREGYEVKVLNEDESGEFDEAFWDELEAELIDTSKLDSSKKKVQNEDPCGAGSPGGKGFAKGNTCGVKGRSRSEIAKKHSGRHATLEIQRYAEEFNEPQFAKEIGGESLSNNEPADIIVETDERGHGIELKTMTIGKNRQIFMKASARANKKRWERKNKSWFHTVVYDDTQVYNANGEGQHDFSKRRIFYRRGYGSFRVDSMLEVESVDEIKGLLDLTRRQLPKSAGGTKKG